jgi:putative tricarboxylic transport membrane protein
MIHHTETETTPDFATARPRMAITPEILTTVTLLCAAVLALIFMSSMVAAPKALFGRTLSAIAPSLFPSIVLVLLAVLCAAALIVLRAGVAEPAGPGLSKVQWMRAVSLFAIMTLYALTMTPFGFLISTAIAVTLISLQMGARSVWQIGLVAIVGPVLLYLCATQLLLVSLPELGVIEMAYARLLPF